MSAHTPGPWTDLDQLEIRTGDAGLPSAAFLCSGSDSAMEEARANWRVCAAAPDMLEALEDLISDVRRQMRNPSHHQPFSYQKALAAVAKATGTEPANRDEPTQDTTGIVPKPSYAALVAERDALRKALEPFLELETFCDDRDRDEAFLFLSSRTLTVGHVRAARAALSPEQQREGE